MMSNLSRRDTMVGMTSASFVASSGLVWADQLATETARIPGRLSSWAHVVVRGYDHERGYGFVTPKWPGDDQPEHDYLLQLKEVGGERIRLKRGDCAWVMTHQSGNMPLPSVVSLAPVVDILFVEILEAVSVYANIPVATIWDGGTLWDEDELGRRPEVERARHMSMYLAHWVTGKDWWRITGMANLVPVHTTPTTITNIIPGIYDVRRGTQSLWPKTLQAVEERRRRDPQFDADLAELYTRIPTKRDPDIRAVRLEI